MAEPAKRRFWGWGVEGAGPSPDQQQGIVAVLANRWGTGDVELAPEPRIEEIELKPPRLGAPRALADRCSTSDFDRAGHT